MNIRKGSYDVGFEAESKLGNAHTLATFRGGGVLEISILSLVEGIGRSGLHLNGSGMGRNIIFPTAVWTAVVTEIGPHFPHPKFKS